MLRHGLKPCAQEGHALLSMHEPMCGTARMKSAAFATMPLATTKLQNCFECSNCSKICSARLMFTDRLTRWRVAEFADASVASARIAPVMRGFLGKLVGDLKHLDLEARLQALQHDAQLADMMPLPTRITSSWSFDV